MSDDLQKRLESKTMYANELLRSLQEKDHENRGLIEERRKLNERLDDLSRKLSRAEGRLADRERDHYVLLDAFKLITRAYHDGADLVDEIESALEVNDPPTSPLRPKMKEQLVEYRTQVMQARQAAGDTYARNAQERLLLKIFKEGALTQGTKAELTRFLESRMEYFRDADHWAEALELLGQQKETTDVRSDDPR